MVQYKFQRFIILIKKVFLLFHKPIFLFPVHLLFESSDLRDYVLHTTVDGFPRGNFTPTSPAERPCLDEPYFQPKRRPERSKYLNHYEFRTKSDVVYPKTYSDEFSDSVYSDSDSRFGDSRFGDSRFGDSRFGDVYFRPKRVRSERSVRVGKSVRFRRRFLPTKVVSGPLEDRSDVVLQWTLDAVHKEEASVVFR